MDNKTVFVVTLRGEGELRNHTRHLSEDLKRALMLVDDTSTVEELTKRAAPSLRGNLADKFQELADGWFIQDRTKMGQVPRMAVPKPLPREEGVAELDFTYVAEQPDSKGQQSGIGTGIEKLATRVKKGFDTVRMRIGQTTIKTKALPGAEAKAKQEAEAAQLKAEQEAAAARAQLEAAQTRIEAEAKARAEVEARAKREAEAARLKAEQESAAARGQLEAAQARIESEARARAEAEARVKREAEEARLKAEQEAAAARAQLEAAQARIENEARARTEAEARVKREAEEARLKAEQEAAAARAQLEAAQARFEVESLARSEVEARAKQEAEAVRLKAEQEAAEARAQLEAAQARIESEARARAEAEARVKQEAEAVRLKAEQEAAEARAQLEAAQARIESEAKARAEVEARAKQEAEAVRLKAEQEAAEAKAQLEAAQARIESEAAARAEAEARVKREAEAARLKAEQDAAEARAQLEAAQARFEVESQARSEVEARAKQEAEGALLKAEQEAAEARAQLEAAQVRIESEARARAEAETRVKREAEAVRLKAEEEAAEARTQLEAAQARIESEARARAEVEARAKQEAEAVRLKAEQEAAEARAQLEAAQARIESEAAARAGAEARVKREAEAARLKAEQDAAEARAQLEAAQARIEVEAQARSEAKSKAKQEAEGALLKAEQEAAEARAQLEAAQARIESEARARAEAEARAKREAEGALLKAEQEAAEARAQLEAAQARIESEARARAEVEARASQEAEAARVKAERETAEARKQLETAQARMEVEAKARAKAEARVNQEAAAARLKAEQEAARLRKEAEAILLEAEQKAAEARAKFEATAGKLEQQTRTDNEKIQDNLYDQHTGRIRHKGALPGPESVDETRKANNTYSRSSMIKPDTTSSRSMIATVLFLDIVGYTKWSVSKQIELKKWFNAMVWGLLSEIEESTRIILDTGDGAAIGFLQHPEQAIEVALEFRQALTENRQKECPELHVRMGINLGPVNVLMDMNGQSNMLGDGINDAQRIMSFAKPDHIYISRSYYDVISRLSGEYVKWLIYRGTEKDKHGRQYQVYEVTKGADKPSGKQPSVSSEAINLGPFTLSGANGAQEQGTPLQFEEALSREPDEQVSDIDIANFVQLSDDVVAKIGVVEQTPIVDSTEAKLPEEEKQQEIPPTTETESAEDKAQLEQDLRRMADEQAKAWMDAEQRARELAAAQNIAKTEQAKNAETREKAMHTPRVPRRPLSLIKISSALFLFLLVLVFILPYIWPMHGYVNRLEKKLSAQIHQPVRIADMKAAFIPWPRLKLLNVSVGNAEELKAPNVVLNFSISALINEVKPLSSVEIDDLEFRADSLGETLPWLAAIGADRQYPVQRIEVQNAHLSNSDLNLPSMSGNASFDGQGNLLKAMLSSKDNNLDILLQPLEANNQIVFNLKNGGLPPFPGIRFDELNLKGNLGNNQIIFSEMDGRLYGGEFSGKAKVNWQNGWQVLGHTTVDKMALGEAFPDLGIDGEMQGDAEFKMASASLQQLAHAVSLDGNFHIKKSTLNRLDILEAARQSNANHVTGGRTHLDDVSGILQAQNNSVSIRQLEFSSEVMNGSGAINVGPDGRISGQLSVELKVKPDRVSLLVSGTTEEPLLAPAH